MKIKLFLASMLITVLGIIFYSQVSFANADTISGGGPISYTITGQVLYRYNGWFRPATSASIEALNITTRQKYSTVTDRFGKYSITLPNSTYHVRVFDKRDTLFLPLVKVATQSASFTFIGPLRVW